MADPNKVGKGNGWGWNRKTIPKKGKKPKPVAVDIEAEPSDDTDKQFRDQYMNELTWEPTMGSELEAIKSQIDETDREIRRTAMQVMGIDMAAPSAEDQAEGVILLSDGRTVRVIGGRATVDAETLQLLQTVFGSPVRRNLDEVMKECESALETHERVMEHFK